MYLALDKALRDRYLVGSQLKEGTIATVALLMAPASC